MYSLNLVGENELGLTAIQLHPADIKRPASKVNRGGSNPRKFHLSGERSLAKIRHVKRKTSGTTSQDTGGARGIPRMGAGVW